MAILTDNKLQEAPQLTQEQADALKNMRLQMTTNNILEVVRETYNQLVNVQRRGIDMVWNHPYLTPHEIVANLGNNAVKVFEFHGALTAFVYQLAESAGVDVDLKSPTNAFSVLSGNIVISDQPYSA